jgi:serine/threonine protein kinase
MPSGIYNMRDKIDELLSQWEDGFERGDPPSAEQLCADCPELLDELRSQINAIKAIESNLGSLMGHSTQTTDERLRVSRLNQHLQVMTEFRIERLHASGGLGDVYLASEQNLGRQVAIKFPRQANLSRQQMARFEREAQITGRLNHPGIVPVFSLKQDEAESPCYVMRFIDGKTLRHRVEQLHQEVFVQRDCFSGLEFRQLLQNFVALCNIIAYAHNQGVIHRDIKPENVIIGPFGETMLMDWGLAKVVDDPATNAPPIPVSNSAETLSIQALKTVEGQVMGTPAYASPEQLQGRVDLTDARSDVYSMGATLYFLIAGTVERIQNAGSSPTNRHGIVVPIRLLAICRKALSGQIENRYQSVITMREDLERYLAGEAISVVPETVWSRFVRSVRRRPGLSAAFLVGVTMAIVAGVAGSLLLNQKNRELTVSNQKLGLAVDEATVAKKRATSSSAILKRAMLAATPEEAQGTEPTVRQLLDDLSVQLVADDSIDSLVVADTHYTLAEAYDKLGEYETAQGHADASFAIFSRELGLDSTETLYVQGLQAKILTARDLDSEALKLAGAALARARKIELLDPDCLITLLDVYATAAGFAPDPDYNDVLALHREAYERSLQEFGPNHATTLNMASNLAAQMMDNDDLVGAEVLLTEIHNAHESLRGKSHPETLVDVLNLIILTFKKGEFQAANDLCQVHVPVFEEVFGPNHQTSIHLQIVRSQTEAQLGRLADAYDQAEIAWQRAKEHLGPLHQRTFESRGIMLQSLLFQDKLDEAEELCEEYFEIAREAFGPAHHYTVGGVTLLFDLAEKRNDPDMMAKWAEHLRDTPLAGPAAEQVKAAREKKRLQELEADQSK